MLTALHLPHLVLEWQRLDGGAQDAACCCREISSGIGNLLKVTFTETSAHISTFSV